MDLARGVTRVAIALALIAVVVPVAGGGASALRGGNHGCDQVTGTVFSDHFWEDGDRVNAGFYQDEVGFPSSTQDHVTVANPGTTGSGNRVTCGAPEGTWRLFTSDLGPGNDRARTDGAGLEVLRGGEVPTVGPLPKEMRTRILGRAGRDRLLGRKGVDKLKGGGGDDVIKAADGGKRDVVRCGGGEDKAVVDPKDKTSGCERLIER